MSRPEKFKKEHHADWCDYVRGVNSGICSCSINWHNRCCDLYDQHIKESILSVEEIRKIICSECKGRCDCIEENNWYECTFYNNIAQAIHAEQTKRLLGEGEV